MTPVSAASRAVNKLPAPVGVSASAGDAHVTVDWTEVPGAIGYHVYRSTSAVWDSAPIARVNGRIYRDGGLPNGATYAYRVSAFNLAGDGPQSAIVTGTPLASPVGVVAAPGDATVTLTWNASAGATSYVVYRGTSSWSIDTMVPIANGVSALEFMDAGLTNGTTYYYRVRAQAGGSQSKPSHAVAVNAGDFPEPVDVRARVGRIRVKK